MTSDPAEIDDNLDLAPTIQLVEQDEVVGTLPVEVLVQQLEQVMAINNDLRLMLKEARFEIRQQRGEINNLHLHTRAAEESLRVVQAQSEARHAEIERVGELLVRAQSELRALQRNPVVKSVRRYNSLRRALGRLRG